jgi:hypothetical protein
MVLNGHDKQEDIVNVMWFPLVLLQVLTMISVICVGYTNILMLLDNKAKY